MGLLLDVFLLGYIAYRNSTRAKIKGLNSWFWGGITIFSFFSGLFIGMFVVVFGFCGDVVNLAQMSTNDPKAVAAVSQQLVDAINANPLHGLTIFMFGIGGYLLVRYVLEQKPEKKQPEVHWMDKLGENR